MDECIAMLDSLYQYTIEKGEKFKFDDGTLGKVEEESIISFNKVKEFIEENLEPACSKELLELLKKNHFKRMEYFEKENEMFFKEGFACAVNLITGCQFAK